MRSIFLFISFFFVHASICLYSHTDMWSCLLELKGEVAAMHALTRLYPIKLATARSKVTLQSRALSVCLVVVVVLLFYVRG